jgi:hypothetical protein
MKKQNKIGFKEKMTVIGEDGGPKFRRRPL